MSTLPRIHGRIAAKPRHSCAIEVLNVRYALVCRDMASHKRYWSHVAAIGAAIVVGIIGASVI